MLTRLRNALAVHKREVVLPYSNMKYSIAKILESEGFVGAVEKTTEGKHPALRIALAYASDKAPRIRNVRRISKPGRRVYAKSGELPTVMSGTGIAIISTPNGLMTNKQARTRKLGGEIICEVF
jgi:small subunit ribosomal protein S8